MGCNQSKQGQLFIPQNENEKIVNINKQPVGANQPKCNVPSKQNLRVKDSNSNNINSSFQNKSETDWQSFPDREKAIKILLKDQQSISDLEFLIDNKLWKEEWFIRACQQFNITMNKCQKFQEEIMMLFLKLMLKDARLSESDLGNGIFCPECYKQQIQSYKLSQNNINKSLFQECRTCQSIGWVKAQQNQKKIGKQEQCQKCQQTIEQYSNIVQCSNCNTMGYKWIA